MRKVLNKIVGVIVCSSIGIFLSEELAIVAHATVESISVQDDNLLLEIQKEGDEKHILRFSRNDNQELSNLEVVLEDDDARILNSVNEEIPREGWTHFIPIEEVNEGSEMTLLGAGDDAQLEIKYKLLQSDDTNYLTVQNLKSSEEHTTSTLQDLDEEVSDGVIRESEIEEIPNQDVGDIVTSGVYIPKGAITLDGTFADPQGGAVVSKIQNQQNNNGIPYSIISLSGQSNWTSVWSLDNTKLDFSSSFEGRAYINFGTNQADGFAFVMQNDPRGTLALTDARNLFTDGQNLGVYGWMAPLFEVGSNNLLTPEFPAIKNSVAVEFDLYSNQDAGNNAFDVGIPQGPHMAYTFPGSSIRGYKPVSSDGSDADGWANLLGGTRKARIQHNAVISLDGTISTQVQDGTWYEFRYKFDDESSQFSYYLRNTVTGEETEHSVIPWPNLREELKLSANGNTAYWGFTAANGNSDGETKIVFSKSPVTQQVKVSNDVLNQELESVAVDSASTDSSKYIGVGESAIVQSEVAVMDGEAPYQVDEWRSYLDVNVWELNLETDIFNITAINSETGEVKQGVVSEIDGSSGEVIVTFPALTVNVGESVILRFEIQARSSNLEIQKTMTESIVIGHELGSSQSTVYNGDEKYLFVRNVNEPIELSWSTTDILKDLSVTLDRADIDDEYLSSFYWRDSDLGDEIKILLKKENGDTIQEFEFETAVEDSYIEQEILIDENFLEYGENVFIVESYRRDNLDEWIKEDELQLTLEITGQLIFREAPDVLKWTGRSVRESKGILPRDSNNDINIVVQDSREISDHWRIGVRISFPEDQQPSFKVIWKSEITEQELSTNSNIFVLTKESANRDGWKYSGSWDSTSGILLKNDQYLSVGDYSGSVNIVWSLHNTEDPE